MRKTWAAVGSLVFLVLEPGTVAGLGPWLMTGWVVREAPWPSAPLRVLGAVLVVLGAAALLVA